MTTYSALTHENMVIFHSYVSLPEGNEYFYICILRSTCCVCTVDLHTYTLQIFRFFFVHICTPASLDRFMGFLLPQLVKHKYVCIIYIYTLWLTYIYIYISVCVHTLWIPMANDHSYWKSVYVNRFLDWFSTLQPTSGLAGIVGAKNMEGFNITWE